MSVLSLNLIGLKASSHAKNESHYRADDINHRAPRDRVRKTDVETIEKIGGRYPPE